MTDREAALAAWLHAHKLKGWPVWRCGGCGRYRQRMAQRCPCRVDCWYDPGAYPVSADEIAWELDKAAEARIAAARDLAIEQRIDERRQERQR